MKDQTMNASKQITGLIGLLIAFILLTVYIALTSAAPIWVETAQMLANVSSLQFHVMVDITYWFWCSVFGWLRIQGSRGTR